MTQQFRGLEGEYSPSGLAAAIRERGPEALTDLCTDVGQALQDLATDPGDVFATETTERASFAVLLTSLQAVRGALDAVEAFTVIGLQDVTRRDRVQAARDAAAHEAAPGVEERAVKAADRATRRDVSLITQRSPHQAGRTLASAQRLVESMPTFMTAMGQGKISAEAAYAVADAGAVLDRALLARVDEVLGERIADFEGAGTRRWKDAVAVTAGELDPEGEAIRHRRARATRCVTLRPGKHGMATLSAKLPAIEAGLIRKRLSLLAEQDRAHGASEGHGASMADAFMDALLDRDKNRQGEDGKDRGVVSVDLGVIITDRALFRPDAGDVAHIEGYGHVPAEAVREQLRAITTDPAEDERDPFGEDGPVVRAVMRRLYTHPVTGELVAMDSKARIFPAPMKRFLTWRDTSCRGPFCNAASRQADHVTPHSRGGPTSLDNGGGLCGHCNQKEHDTLRVERVQDPTRPGHRVQWTGHSGTTRTTAPTPLVGHHRMPPPRSESGDDPPGSDDDPAPPDGNDSTAPSGGNDREDT